MKEYKARVSEVKDGEVIYHDFASTARSIKHFKWKLNKIYPSCQMLEFSVHRPSKKEKDSIIESIKLAA